MKLKFKNQPFQQIAVAIREGVCKSLEITEEYFKTQFDNAPYRYFVYDSKKLSDVRQFAVSTNIEIMIINIDAFRKAENIINQAQDKLNGETAMRYIQDTRPIVIIDEPQSVDNTKKAREGIHDGYFSQDKKGNYKNTKGDSADDFTTYQTIMQKKEWLLSFDCPLRFIWSHSTLKEGWDNPNVFQVCTLLDQKSTFTARQKIGRGLRLCVNQNGERVEDKNINLLHVVANRSKRQK